MKAVLADRDLGLGARRPRCRTEVCWPLTVVMSAVQGNLESWRVERTPHGQPPSVAKTV